MDDDRKWEMPAPAGICDACYHDRDKTRPIDEGLELLVSYCEHNHAGGFIDLTARPHRWTIFTPLNRMQWTYVLQEAICHAIEEDHAHLFEEHVTDVMTLMSCRSIH
jgi:hypothetical protein